MSLHDTCIMTLHKTNAAFSGHFIIKRMLSPNYSIDAIVSTIQSQRAQIQVQYLIPSLSSKTIQKQSKNFLPLQVVLSKTIIILSKQSCLRRILTFLGNLV